MTMQTRAFKQVAATQSTTSSASSQSVAINNTNGTRAIRMANIGSETVFLAFGEGSAPTATLAASMPILAGTVEVFTINKDVTHYALIGTGTTSVLYSTVGEGV